MCVIVFKLEAGQHSSSVGLQAPPDYIKKEFVAQTHYRNSFM